MPVEGGRIKAIKRIAIASGRKHRLALARAQDFFLAGGELMDKNFGSSCFFLILLLCFFLMELAQALICMLSSCSL